jgi:predicted AAA+ superfamily ATPase
MLLWNNVNYDLKKVSYSKNKPDVKRIFSSYLADGGFPALVVNKYIDKGLIFNGYYDSMIFKDIIERYKIEDVQKLKNLAN